MRLLIFLSICLAILLFGCITRVASLTEGPAGLVEGSFSGTSAKLSNCTAGDSTQIFFITPTGGSRTRMNQETVHMLGWQNNTCTVRGSEGQECRYTRAEVLNMTSQPIEMMDLIAERCGFK